MEYNTLIENYKIERAELEMNHVVDLFNRLHELFISLKDVQPQIERLHCGMGTYSFSGKVKCQYWDGFDINNSDKIISSVTNPKLIENIDYDDIKIYEGFDNKLTLEDYIEYYLDNSNMIPIDELIEWFIDPDMIEFYHLCNHMVNENLTTYVDGVNENGVIISYGKGSVNDTLADVKDSTIFTELLNANVPIVLHDTVKNKYIKFQ